MLRQIAKPMLALMKGVRARPWVDAIGRRFMIALHRLVKAQTSEIVRGRGYKRKFYFVSIT
jgi:hypothetical protein